MRVIIGGLIGSYPMGGMTWHYIQYVLGFARLGWDVLYLEDTGQWTYNPKLNSFTEDAKENLKYLSSLMERFALGDKWSFRSVNGDYFGVTKTEVIKFFSKADLFINVSGACWFREEYQNCSCAVYLDTDPGYSQIKVAKYVEGDDDPDLRFSVDRMADHHHHFSFGENICNDDCAIPTDLFNWRPTRQPIVLDQWEVKPVKGNSHFTTIMSWKPYAVPLVFRGHSYEGKEKRLDRVIKLPCETGAIMELAVSGEIPEKYLLQKGWKLVEASKISENCFDYQNYIIKSKAEFSVVKDLYVDTRSGWFSERSACYLASGRSVIMEDTAFTKTYPTGEGLHSFQSLEEAVDAVMYVSANISQESNNARSLAEQYFNSDKVIEKLLNDICI